MGFMRGMHKAKEEQMKEGKENRMAFDLINFRQIYTQ